MSFHPLPEKSSLLRDPQVVGSIVNLASLAEEEPGEIREKCDMVEFRVDALQSASGEIIQSMWTCGAPALLTVRSPAEGGQGGLSLDQRDELFMALLPAAALVDVEIAHLADFPRVLELARELDIPVVGSFHDFVGTPDRSALEALTDRALAAGADAVKFATYLRHTGDLAVLTALQESASCPMATMGMGPLGRVSRLVLARLGSVLNYGYLDRPTVPGQWPARRLKEIMAELLAE